MLKHQLLVSRIRIKIISTFFPFVSRSHHRLHDQSSNHVTSLKEAVVGMTIVRRVKDC
jgi:hypothetical protein